MLEKELEKSIIDLLRDQDYFYSKGSDINRDNYSEVILFEDLEKFLRNQEPELSSEDVRIIIWNLEKENEEKNLFDSNKSFFEKLSNKIPYERPESKELFSISIIDFANPKNNIFRVVNQLNVQGHSSTRISDLVIYINGIPFVVWELKSPSNENVTLNEAYEQLQSYLKEIPELFRYNAFSVLCDGSNIKYGVAHANFEHFYEWKKIENNTHIKDPINIAIEGLFNKKKILSIINNFICFSDNNSKDKIICRYPQFFGATKLLKNIEDNLKPDGLGKGGIYFGATGCGKSYTMLFLSRLLLKSEKLNGPSILLITDRNELNDQLASLFKKYSSFLGEKNIRKIDSSQSLKESFEKLTAGGIFLTNIQKFSEGKEELSKRNNIICISDEAHRSQHNLDEQLKSKNETKTFSIPFAKRLRDSLPNATYVGFTATPKDKTMQVFGDIVDQYSMLTSIEDGFTVKISVESRHAKVTLSEEIEKLIDEIYKEYREQGVTEEQIEKSQRKFANLNTLISNPIRVSEVTKDIIEHYERRVEEGATVKGKAMIVTSSRDVGFAVYKKIKELRPDWCIPMVDQECSKKEREKLKPIPKVNMVMSREGKSGELWDLLGNEEHQKELARQFKDEKSNFKIAIVKDKWSTGFDVPSLDTMYLDKMVYDCNLIQTISRVNRKFFKKEEGLIVNYLPIKKFMDEAMKKYCGKEDLRLEIEEINEMIDSAKDKLELLNSLFIGFDKSAFIFEEEKEQIKCIWNAVEFIDSKPQKFSNDFESKFQAFRRTYRKCSSSDLLSKKIRNEFKFYAALWGVWKKRNKDGVPDIHTIGKRIKELVEKAFELGDHRIVYYGQIKINKIEKEDLIQIKECPNPHIANKRLFSQFKETFNQFSNISPKKGLEFSERLRKLVEEYNSLDFGSYEEAENIRNELINLGQEYIDENNFHQKLRIDRYEKVFYDIFADIKEEFKFEYPQEKLILLSKEINKLMIKLSEHIDWYKKESTKNKIKRDIILLLEKHNYPPEHEDKVYEKAIKVIFHLRKISGGEWG